MDSQIHFEVNTIKGLLRAADIVSLVLGIMFIAVGVLTFIAFIGLVFGVFGVMNLVLRAKVKRIALMVDFGNYMEARSECIAWMVVAFILAGVIVGLLLLVAYLKLEDILRITHKREAGV
ncbi:MAG: hypothetical protein QFX33_02100 [Candidatus Nezhaarchaeota archaeon]|nr:hypothetical protein [Candidatus Nezhaarchaeota archaeon]